MTNEEFLQLMSDDIGKQLEDGVGSYASATASTGAMRAPTSEQLVASIKLLGAQMDCFAAGAREAVSAMHTLTDRLRIPDIERLFAPPWLAGTKSLFGVPIVASPNAVRLVPNRVHRRRRNQTQAYHHRVQKKWTKRWGTHAEPVMYLVQAGVIGGGDKPLLIVHDEIENVLKREI